MFNKIISIVDRYMYMILVTVHILKKKSLMKSFFFYIKWRNMNIINLNRTYLNLFLRAPLVSC